MIIFHHILATATVDEQDYSAGYRVILMNYELLTGKVDTNDVQTQLFCCDLLTLDDLTDIYVVYEESGRKCACEKMIALMVRTWKEDSLDQFIQVLDDCGYKECVK